MTATTTMLVLSTLEDGYSPAAVLTLWFSCAVFVAYAWRVLMRDEV
jgi:hypothetical protein